jgi:hypothetical protein
MDLEQTKQDIVTASHILHRQGIAAEFGHVSARIPGTDTFIFPRRMSPALVRKDNLLVLDVDGNQLSGEGRPIPNSGCTRGFTRLDPTFTLCVTSIRPVASSWARSAKRFDRCMPPARFSKMTFRFSIS